MPASVPQVLAEWMRLFAVCFTAAVWRHVLVLVAGTLLVPGRRTVTAALRVTALEQTASLPFITASSTWDVGPPGHRTPPYFWWPPSCRRDRS